MANHTATRMSLAAIGLILPALFLAMACGGGGSSSGGGNDAAFVKDVCTAFGKAQVDLNKVQNDPSLQSNDQKAATEVAKVLDSLTASLGKAKPPQDASSEFNQALTALKAATAQLKNGDLSGLDNFQPPDFAPAVKTRLQTVAGSEKACDGVDVFNN